jgi:hypothetical protein
VFQVADCDVKYVLSFKPGTMDGLQVPELMIRKDPELAGGELVRHVGRHGPVR